MRLPITPPLAPMLARRADSLPSGDYLYEPKWDGFRCLAFRRERDVDLRSRNDRPLARYFPELVGGLAALAEGRLVLDGEIVVSGAAGYDFDALLGRIHPAATRVERLSRETPARASSRSTCWPTVARTCESSRPRKRRRGMPGGGAGSSHTRRVTRSSHTDATSPAQARPAENALAGTHEVLRQV